MISWSVLDMAKIPGDGGELRLKKRGAEFSIMLGDNSVVRFSSALVSDPPSRRSWLDRHIGASPAQSDRRPAVRPSPPP